MPVSVDTPAVQRICCYFTFSILHADRLVGLFDTKLYRQSGVLHLHPHYLEPGVKPTDELVDVIAAVMRDFMAWYGTTEQQIESSDLEESGVKFHWAL